MSRQPEDDAELQLILGLLGVSEEAVPDADSAALLLDRAMYHFMRLTTLRRNARKAVSEAELEPALCIAESIFRNDSLLDHVVGAAASASDVSASSSLLSNVVCVMLDELLSFLDEAASGSTVRNDPPAFHVRRIVSARNLIRRVRRHRGGREAVVLAGVFRQTLPGVASRCCALLSRTFNGACSVAATRAQRESCAAAAMLLAEQLAGCDFAGWLRGGGGGGGVGSAAGAAALGALTRVSSLLCAVSESLVSLAVFHAEQGGTPGPSGSAASSVAASWFGAAVSDREGCDLRSAILALAADDGALRPLLSLRSEEQQRSLLDPDRRLGVEQLRAAKAALDALQLAALRWWCVSARWLAGAESAAAPLPAWTAELLRGRLDDVCFQRAVGSAAPNPRQHLRCVLLFDAAHVCSAPPALDAAHGDGAVVLLARRRQLFRHLLLGVSSAIEAVQAVSRSASASAPSAATLVVATGSSDGAAESAAHRDQLSHFEKWLGAAQPHAAVRHSPLAFLLDAARDAARRGDFFALSAAASNSGDDDASPEQLLARWLAEEIVPLLADPFEFRVHHAAALLVMCTLQALIGDSAGSGAVGGSIDAVHSLLWSDAWSCLWDGVVTAPFPRSLAEHWDKCNAAQKRFRVTLNGVLCKIIGAVGAGIARQQQQLLLKRRSKKSGGGGARRAALSDAADRFLLLAVRELLNVASTDVDVAGIARDSAMASLHGIAAAFAPMLLQQSTAAASAASSEPQQQEQEANLLALLRHSIASVVDVCARELRGEASTEAAETFAAAQHRLLGNCRVLSAAAMLCVQQQQQRGVGSSVTAELMPTIGAIAETTAALLREGVEQRRGVLFAPDAQQPELARTARALLLAAAHSVAEFTRGAMREQDSRWTAAAAAATSTQQQQDRRPGLPAQRGNFVRRLYISGALKRPPLPGQTAVLSTDAEWMETEDFNAFVDPQTERLQQIIVADLLRCAIASLGAQYFSPAASAAAFSSSSSSGGVKAIRAHCDASLLALEGHSSAAAKWNVVAAGGTDDDVARGMGSPTAASAAVVSTPQQQERLRVWTNTASVTERAAGVKLCVACLKALATTTPASYFEQLHDCGEEAEAAAEVSESSLHMPGDPGASALVLSALREPPVRIARGHWTSVFKVFHALQSLLLAARDRSTGSFRDIPSAAAFLHRFAAAIRSSRRMHLNQQQQEVVPSGNTRQRDAARIELRSCVDTLGRAMLLADESIVLVPDACAFLVAAAPVFLMYRAQTEVLPLLALQWLSLCRAKEPELWSRLTAGGDSDGAASEPDPRPPAPRTLVARNFHAAVLRLRTVCGLAGPRAADATGSSTESAPERELRRVVDALETCLLR